MTSEVIFRYACGHAEVRNHDGLVNNQLSTHPSHLRVATSTNLSCNACRTNPPLPTPRDAQWQHLLPGINTFELPASNTQANNTGAMVNDASASGVGGSSNPQRVTSLTRSTFAASSRGSFLDEVAASVAHWNAQPMTLPTVVQGTAPIGEVTTVAPESILNPRVEAFVARGRPTTSFANPYSQNLGASMLMHSDYNDMYQAQQDSFIRGYDVQPYRLYGHGDQDTFYNNAYNSSMAPNSSGRETALIPYGHETSAVPYSYESAMVLRRQRPSAVNAMISGNELVVYDTDQAAVDAVAPDDRLLRHRAGRRCPDGVATCHFHHGVACHQEWSSCYFAKRAIKAAFLSHSAWRGAPLGWNSQHERCLQNDPTMCSMHTAILREAQGHAY